MTAYTFDQLITFTRTSAATYVGSNGLVAVTPASRNLLIYTQEFDNAAWAKGTGVTVTANAGAAPDGTQTADNVVFATGGATEFLRVLPAMTVGVTYTYSIYVRLVSGTPTFTFDVGNGTPSAAQTPTSVWQRFTHTFTFSGPNQWIDIQLSAAATLAFWGAQLEVVPDANLVLGSELVSNGDFASGSTGWTLGSGVTISGGAAQFASVSSGVGISQTVSPVFSTSSVYRVSVTISGYTAGTLSVRCGSGGAFNALPAANGTHTITVFGGAANGTLQFFASAAPASFTIDNITVKEITGTTGMPTTYTRNNGGVYPPRFDYDPVTRAPRGLLIEEQRTNLLLRSEEFDNASWVKLRSSVTANATTSPDGTVDADKLVEDTTASDTHLVSQGATLSAVSHTFTVYVKAAERSWVHLVNNSIANVSAYFNVGSGAIGTVGSAATASITNAGNGWYRCSIAFTASAGTNNMHIRLATANNTEAYTGDGTSGLFLYGAQLEAGAFATSYIPTVASQVTRTADQATVTAPMFAPWYRQSEGTFVVQASIPYTTANLTYAHLFYVSDGTVNNRNTARLYGSGGLNQAQYVVLSAGATVAAVLPGNAPTGAAFATACSYKQDDFAASLDGGMPATDTSGAVNLNASQLSIGAGVGSAQPLNGHIQSIDYYPTRLTNAQIQALTA